jgi:hypothetical protein
MALVGHISGSSQSNSVIGVSGSVIIANRSSALFPALPGSDVSFFVSGSAASDLALFGGGFVSSGSLTVKNASGGNSFTVASATGNTVVQGTLQSVGAFTATGGLTATSITGSITKLAGGGDYLRAGSNITLTTGSLGEVTIASTGGGTPGGSDTQIQFNDGGSTFGGDSGLTYNKTTDTLTVAGDLAVNGGDMTTTATTFNLLNGTVTSLNLAGAGTDINVGSNAAGALYLKNATTNISGASVHAGNATFNANVTLGDASADTITVNGTTTFAGAAVTTTLAGSGSIAGTLTVAGATTLNGAVTVGDASADTVTVNGTTTFAGAAVTTTLAGSGSIAGTLTVGGATTLNGAVTVGDASADTVTVNGTTTFAGAAVTTTFAGDIAVNGGDVTTTATTFNLVNATATTLNVGGAATALTMGDATTATTTIRGGTLVGNTTTQNLFNTTATTLNIGGAATTVEIGAATGTTSVNNDLTVDGNTTLGNATSDTVTFTARSASSFLPSADVTHDLGSASLRWANIYTGDLHLKNERGDYTLIEEPDFLTIRFNKTGKRYKFMLEAVPELDEELGNFSSGPKG